MRLQIPFRRHEPTRVEAIRTRLERLTPQHRRAEQARARRRKRAMIAGVAVGAASAAALAGRALLQPERRARLLGAMRNVPGHARGLAYKALRRHPDEDVSDQVLADRVRSMLGPLEKRLDVPHVHVTTCEGVVSLHGSVGSAEEAARLVDATRGMPGVRAVESHLHVGLTATDTRPSDGKRRARADV